MNIDKIYIISLQAGDHTEQKRLADKLESLGLRNPTGFEVVQGFNGKTDITPHGHSTYPKWNLGNATGNDWWKRDITPGEVGCAISHTRVWNKILEDGVETALILEDDFTGVIDLSTVNLPHDDWDIAYLGRHSLFLNKEIRINNEWNEALASYNTHAYVIKNKTANTLLNKYKFTSNLIAVDEFLTATYTTHRRNDISSMFKPNLTAIAPALSNYIEQDRPHSESTTEPSNKNINLITNINIKAAGLEILDDSDWEAWKLKYVNQTICKGEYDLMVDDLGNNIYEFPLFTDKFCEEAVALASTVDKWTQDRHKFYPTNDVLLPEIGLDEIYKRVLHDVVFPISIHLWKLEGTGWDNMSSENFMARYTTDRQSHLSLHHDFSHITMVVKLNDEFDGGGTWFPKYKTLSNPKRVGTATLHPGMITHLHGARPITVGTRYINVSFMRKNN